MISSYEGEIEVRYGEISCEGEIEIDLRDGVYARVRSEVCGEEVEILLEDEEIYVRVGEVVVKSELSEIRETIKRVEEAFDVEIRMPEIGEEDLTLERIKGIIREIKGVELEGLRLTIGEGIAAIYEEGGLRIEVRLSECEEIEKAEEPEGTTTVEEVIEKVKEVNILIN